jgi:hypothetical protein
MYGRLRHPLLIIWLSLAVVAVLVLMTQEQVVEVLEVLENHQELLLVVIQFLLEEQRLQ